MHAQTDSLTETWWTSSRQHPGTKKNKAERPVRAQVLAATSCALKRKEKHSVHMHRRAKQTQATFPLEGLWQVFKKVSCVHSKLTNCPGEGEKEKKLHFVCFLPFSTTVANSNQQHTSAELGELGDAHQDLTTLHRDQS